MAAYTNTLAALNGIAGSLEIILENTAPKNKTNSEDTGIGINNLHTATSTVGESTPKPEGGSNATIKSTKVSIPDVNAINNIFVIIRNSKDIKEKDLKKVIKIFDEFGPAVEKLAKSLKDVKPENFNAVSTMVTTVGMIPKVITPIALMAPLMPMFVLSAAILAPGIRVLGWSLQSFGKIGSPENIKPATEGLLNIGKFVLELTIITGSLIGMAYFVGKARPIIEEGLGVTLGIFGGLVGLTIVMMAASIFLKGGDFAFLEIANFMVKMVALSFMIVGLGVLIRSYEVETVEGFVLFAGMLGLVVGISFLARKVAPEAVAGATAMFTISQMMFVAAFTVAAVIGLGAFIRAAINNDFVTWGDIGLAFLAMSLVCVAAFGLTFLAKRVSEKAAEGAKGLLAANLVILTSALTVASVVGVSMLMHNANIEWKDLFMTLTGMAGVLVLAGVLAMLADNLKNKIIKGALGLMLCVGVVAVSGLVVMEAIGISKIVNDELGGWEPVFICLGAMGTVIAGVGLIAGIAGKFAKEIGVGGAVLLECLAVAGISLGLVYAISKVTKLILDEFGEWSPIFICLGAMTSVVTAFGVLAGVAGALAGTIAIGGVVLLECEVVAGASLLLITAMAKVAKLVKDELNDEWSPIFICLGAMASVVTAFGALAGAAGLIAPIIAIGGAVLIECEVMAAGAAALVFSLINVVKAVKQLDAETQNKGWETIKLTVDAIKDNVLNPFKDIAKAAALGAGDIRRGAKALEAVIEMSLSTENMVMSLVRLHNVLKTHPVEELKNIALNISDIMSSYADVSEEAGKHAIRVWAGSKSLLSVIDLSHSFDSVIRDLIATQNLLNTVSMDTLINLSSKISVVILTYADVAEEAGKHARRIRNGAESLLSIVELSSAFNKVIYQINNTPQLNATAANNYFNALTCFINSIVTPIEKLNKVKGSNEISKFDKSLTSLMNNVIKSSSKPNIARIKDMSAAILKTSESLDKLDKVLITKNDERIKSINTLKDAIKELADKLSGLDNKSIESLQKLITELNNADPTRISSVVESIGNMDVGGGGGLFGGRRRGGGTSAETITEAIIKALDEATIYGNLQTEIPLLDRDGTIKPVPTTIQSGIYIDLNKELEHQTEQ